MRRFIAVTLALYGVILSAPAQAAPRDDRGHDVALSISPLHLIFPMLEVQAEFYVNDFISLSVIGGFGQVTAEVQRVDPRGRVVGKEDADFGVFELGGQVRGYFYGGSEEGAYAAAEVLFVRVDGTVDGVTGLGAGTSVGPLVGYKWTWDNFFIDLSGGLSVIVVGAEAEDDETGERDSEESSGIGPNLNFNLGWAF